jgi:hypothetical protein
VARLLPLAPALAFLACHSRRESASAIAFVVAVAFAFLVVIPAGNLLLSLPLLLLFWLSFRAQRANLLPARWATTAKHPQCSHSAPKGRFIPAQGKALGWRTKKHKGLKARLIRSVQR